MAVHNIMEEIVRDVLVNYQHQYQLTCNCERCLDDVKAIALNHLKPHYVTIEAHVPFARVPHLTDRQGVTTVLTEVTKAAVIVSDNPRCK
ncbi:late competence development ComFB family protein [Sporosarcina sp. FSL K6-1522]|uniref:late competence development ComFB family protein n=1 Tax=Sporosarcina sp. FSL K6-1522 TaxID=2921554 RepID=UPI003159A9AE